MADAENYSLKIKYNPANKQKVVELLASQKITAEELGSKYAENWLLVKQGVAEEKISELEKKLLEVDDKIVVEKVKKYSVNDATGRTDINPLI